MISGQAFIDVSPAPKAKGYTTKYFLPERQLVGLSFLYSKSQKGADEYIKLTLKQQRFADEYIISGNATDAAIKAGYSEKYANTNASKLLQNTTVKAYIDARLDDLASKKIADQHEVLAYLTSVLRGETQSEIVVVEGVGDGCSEARRLQKLPDEKERLKAAELLGKRMGLFKDKLDITANVPVIISGGDELED
ncbi:terminase small subunit family protein [Lachnospiraceae bacterium oral taxon 082 str. F0431]|jgi:terminase small subunit|nr:terminase small subunit family protein [Lachnospiraceae bacterium oral taxon 082 str. F0431]DAI53692.1 MAG TPA: Terminase small subunit [Caudoviricetes sp.]